MDMSSSSRSMYNIYMEYQFVNNLLRLSLYFYCQVNVCVGGVCVFGGGVCVCHVCDGCVWFVCVCDNLESCFPFAFKELLMDFSQITQTNILTCLAY